MFAFTPPAVTELGNATGFELQLAGPRRARPRRADGGAQPAPRARRARTRALAKVRPRRPRGHAAVQDRRRPGEGRRARALARRHERDALRRPGAAPTSTTSSTRAARSASTCRPTRRSACSPRTSTAGTCATARARWCRSRRSPPARWTFGSPKLERFNGFPTIAIQGEPAPGTSSGEAMAAMEELVEQLPHGHRLRVDRPLVRGAALRRERAGALRAVAARRVPVPRRAVRELVDPGVGDARRAARRARRGGRDAARRPRERRLLPGRPAHDDRPLGEERDPHRRVREGAARAGHGARRGGARGGAHAPAADPHDVARVHPRRAAARARERRRRRRARTRSASRSSAAWSRRRCSRSCSCRVFFVLIARRKRPPLERAENEAGGDEDDAQAAAANA